MRRISIHLIGRSLAITWLVVGLSTSATGMTIDIFTASQGPASDSTGGGATNSMAGPQSGNIVPASGSRELFAEKTNSGLGRARLGVDSDALFYSAHSTVSGRFDVSYLDLGGADLSFGDGVTISGFIDPAAASGTGTLLGLFVEDTNSNFGRSELLLSTDGNFTHTYQKTDFAGVDFSTVDTIRLGTFQAATGNFVDVPVGSDVRIDSLEVTAVPEPEMIWLPALALAGSLLVLARVRKSISARPTTSRSCEGRTP